MIGRLSVYFLVVVFSDFFSFVSFGDDSFDPESFADESFEGESLEDESLDEESFDDVSFLSDGDFSSLPPSLPPDFFPA